MSGRKRLDPTTYFKQANFGRICSITVSKIAEKRLTTSSANDITRFRVYLYYFKDMFTKRKK